MITETGKIVQEQSIESIQDCIRVLEIVYTHSRNTLFLTIFSIKKRVLRNEFLGLAWDRMKVS